MTPWAAHLAFLSLALIACVVGVFIGAVGIGGVLLIPALNVLGGLTVHAASATALFTFIFTGILGTILFQRHGSIDWTTALPICASAVLFGFVGAWSKFLIGAVLLNQIIALIVLSAGAYILLPARRRPLPAADKASARRAVLLAVGAFAGFGSGLSGAGGPLFSVPLMLVLGFAPLAAIGVSQVLQIMSAASGTWANLAFGAIEFRIASWVTVLELAGVWIGAWAAHVVSVRRLRQAAAWLCVVVGSAMFLRGLWDAR